MNVKANVAHIEQSRVPSELTDVLVEVVCKVEENGELTDVLVEVDCKVEDSKIPEYLVQVPVAIEVKRPTA